MKDTTIKPIPGFDGYFAGSDGQIYSPLKGCMNTKGKYFQVSVRCSETKLFLIRGVHRLICMAFYGLPKPDDTASHQDGNSFNNHPDNLRWESMSKNHRRKILHGTDDCGFRNSRASISEDELRDIRALLKEGKMTHKQIGFKIGVQRAFISKIATGLRYAKC